MKTIEEKLVELAAELETRVGLFHTESVKAKRECAQAIRRILEDCEPKLNTNLSLRQRAEVLSEGRYVLKGEYRYRLFNGLLQSQHALHSPRGAWDQASPEQSAMLWSPLRTITVTLDPTPRAKD